MDPMGFYLVVEPTNLKNMFDRQIGDHLPAFFFGGVNILVGGFNPFEKY